jgi:hypothetical protein
MMYTVTIKFQADRELNEREKEALLGAIELQIQEPWNAQGEEEEYATVLQEITIKGESK